MTEHQFLFVPGYWIGEGKISFNNIEQIIKFYTRWIIPEEKENQIYFNCTQEVEIQGEDKRTINYFQIQKHSDEEFSIRLSNELVENAEGKGVISPKKIAWEIRNTGSFDGYEVYELQENGDYLFHAEYVSPEFSRSFIDGRIWKKTPPSPHF